MPRLKQLEPQANIWLEGQEEPVVVATSVEAIWDGIMQDVRWLRMPQTDGRRVVIRLAAVSCITPYRAD